MNKHESSEFVKQAKDWIDDKGGTDIKVLDISEVSDLADFFVIASGSSERQVNAIADNIQEQASTIGFEPKNVEGLRSGRWILLDFYDVIFHIFHEQDRDFYNLEKLWTDAKVVE